MSLRIRIIEGSMQNVAESLKHYVRYRPPDISLGIVTVPLAMPSTGHLVSKTYTVACWPGTLI